MKRILLIFSILIFQLASAQQTVDSLLSAVSFNDQHISLKNFETGSDYFSYMSLGKNFFLKKPHNTCCDFIVYHIKTIEGLSYYGMIATYDLEDKELLDPTEHSYILFDSKVQKCFILESNGMGLGGIEKIDSEKIIVGINQKMKGCVGRIVMLNKNLVPVAGIYVGLEYQIYIRDTYTMGEVACYRKRLDLLKYKPSFILLPTLNTMLYADFLALLDTPVNAAPTNCQPGDGVTIYHIEKSIYDK